jgi:hypothetical protein
MFTLPPPDLQRALPMFSLVKIRVSLVFALLLFSLSAAKCYATTYYVSKNGSNADGLTWATAWNEMNQIKWAQVQPQDVVAIDGGTTSMTYTTTMTIPACLSGGLRRARRCFMIVASRSGGTDAPVWA